jgi:hypothetical protein
MFLFFFRSRSYFTIDGQSVCLGVEPTLGLATRYYFLSQCYCLKVAGFFFLSFCGGAISDESFVCVFLAARS